MWDKKKLLEICEKYSKDGQAPTNAVFPEPYLPYMPKQWNGILVLAESQIIWPEDKDKYCRWLKDIGPEKRMTRLKQKPYGDNRIGVGPWDGKKGEKVGIAKFALQAIFEEANPNLKVDDIAVSNAVPWTKKNNKESDDRQDKAVEFWGAIFAEWKPDIKIIVMVGKVAKDVMKKAGGKYEGLELQHPSPKNINNVSKMFDCNDLLRRFPEVQKAKEVLKIDENEPYYKNKIVYACHAVSLGVKKFKDCFGLTASQ